MFQKNLLTRGPSYEAAGEFIALAGVVVFGCPLTVWWN